LCDECPVRKARNLRRLVAWEPPEHGVAFRARGAGGLLAAIALALGGCAGPPPRLFPVAPVQVAARADGGWDRWYDTDGDGRADYCEQLSADGLITTLGYDTTGDGRLDEQVELAAVPADQCRHLILLLDSVPFGMVQDLRAQGRFRFFPPPSQVISPFPVMTDPSFAELFGTTPTPGVESEHFDGRRLTNGYIVYANKGNVPWQAHVDYYLAPALHACAYLWPRAWYDHELRRVEETFEGSTGKKLTAYLVGTSAVGARIGRNGHQAGLIKLDRLCQALMYKAHGRLRITMLSDHGHNLVSSRRVPLSDLLREFGYRVHDTLEKPDDVVVPEFGMVTCAAIHTRIPAAAAADAVGIEGIELAAYRDPGGDDVVVLSRSGRARIAHSPAGLRYRAEQGDPLAMLAVLEQLAQQGKVDADGFVDDRVLFEATAAHEYPDAVYRLWRAFHGLIQHTPDVLLSVQDGWHCGSPTQSRLVQLMAAHGNLRPLGSLGFAMSMAGPLPPLMRMAELGRVLEQKGVPLNSGV